METFIIINIQTSDWPTITNCIGTYFYALLNMVATILNRLHCLKDYVLTENQIAKIKCLKSNPMKRVFGIFRWKKKWFVHTYLAFHTSIFFRYCAGEPFLWVNFFYPAVIWSASLTWTVCILSGKRINNFIFSECSKISFRCEKRICIWWSMQ